jgi:peptidylprolyl isomerase
MRRFLAAIAIPLLAGATIAGCSSSKSAAGSSSATADSAGNTNASVTATGAYGKAPTVIIPAAAASSQLAVRTLVDGTGAAITTADAFVGNYVVYIWSGKTHKLAASTWTSTPQVFSGSLLPGLETGLMGKKVGSRVLVVIPPADGYGSAGDTSNGVTGTDTLVFVVDLVGAVAANASATGTQAASGAGLPTVTDTTGAAPTIKIPANTKAPTALIKKTLITGTGPKVTSGQYLVVQYTGVNWRTGKVFDSSWSRKTPLGFEIDQPEGMIVGFDLGLTGQTVGSRVLLVIPPADGYGKTGNSEGGIKGTDDIVFVVDILGAYN